MRGAGVVCGMPQSEHVDFRVEIDPGGGLQSSPLCLSWILCLKGLLPRQSPGPWVRA